MSTIDPPPPPPGSAPSQPSPEEVTRAMLHGTEDTRTYPCGACGGQLEFDIEAQRLRCPHCGNVQEIVEDAGRVTVEQDFASAVTLLRTRTAVAPQLAGEKEVVCQSCGGHTTFTGTLTSTRCPYCNTPIQRDDVHDAPSRLPVDGVVPFRVGEDNARAAVEAWISSRRFAPSEFKKYRETGSFSSVYASYFTYDAETMTDYSGRRGDNYTVTVGSGDNRRTETRVRWRQASGTVRNSFDDLCVLANDGFNRKRVGDLEPWPTQTARPFSAEYLAGHLCRTYDRDVEACFPEAQNRINQAIVTTIERDIGGDHQDIRSKRTSYGSLTFKHLLLPIWLLVVTFEGEPFQVFVNGVTGEVQGVRPWSKVKIALAVVVGLIILAAIFFVWSGSR